MANLTLKNRKQTTMQQTKKQQTARFFDLMAENGFTYDETAALLKAERALRKWGELACGTGDGNRSVNVFRDESGRPFYRVQFYADRQWRESVQPKRDTEKAALAKVEAIMARKPGFRAYHQTDPRGCSLYIIRPGDIEAGGNVHALYNRGIALCVA
jgi:hypothetical protein